MGFSGGVIKVSVFSLTGLNVLCCVEAQEKVGDLTIRQPSKPKDCLPLPTKKGNLQTPGLKKGCFPVQGRPLQQTAAVYVYGEEAGEYLVEGSWAATSRDVNKATCITT